MPVWPVVGGHAEPVVVQRKSAEPRQEVDFSQSTSRQRSCATMSVTYTATLPVSEDTVLFVAGLLHAERRRLGTRTEALFDRNRELLSQCVEMIERLERMRHHGRRSD